jgi:hypothetical protein
MAIHLLPATPRQQQQWHLQEGQQWHQQAWQLQQQALSLLIAAREHA